MELNLQTSEPTSGDFKSEIQASDKHQQAVWFGIVWFELKVTIKVLLSKPKVTWRDVCDTWDLKHTEKKQDYFLCRIAVS